MIDWIIQVFRFLAKTL